METKTIDSVHKLREWSGVPSGAWEEEGRRVLTESLGNRVRVQLDRGNWSRCPIEDINCSLT